MQRKLLFVTHELEPIWDADSRVLILGTMPSPASREAMFYYAHPQNRFWATLAWVLGERTPITDADKRKLALTNHIAIWDVVKRCEIKSADDASIKRAEANPVEEIIRRSRVRTVFTTGKKAYELYNRLCRPALIDIDVVCLPSTSPANRRVSDAGLRGAYSVIKEALSSAADDT